MSNLGDMIKDTMSKIKELIDVNMVVGQPINTPDGTTLIPVSKVTFGFASGGADTQQDAPSDKTAKNPHHAIRYGAASGVGVSIKPEAFVVVENKNVRILYLATPTNTTLDKIVDMVPGIIDKFKKSDEDDA